MCHSKSALGNLTLRRKESIALPRVTAFTFKYVHGVNRNLATAKYLVNLEFDSEMMILERNEEEKNQDSGEDDSTSTSSVRGQHFWR